jgi:hypothetical protein
MSGVGGNLVVSGPPWNPITICTDFQYSREKVRLKTSNKLYFET